MEKEQIIALLINPFAEKKKADKIIAEIETALSEKNICFKIFIEQWPDQINIYKEAWVIGGDGTLNYFLNLYKNISVPVSIFKAGTGNDFAWKLYGEMKINEQIEHVLSVPAKPVDAAKCNEHVFINGIGIGFDGEVVRSIKTIRWIGGHIGYLLAVIKQIFFYKELFLEIECNEENINGKFLLTMVCNSSRMGGGFMISPQSKIDDGLLNLILAKPLNLFKRFRYLPVIEKGKHLQLDFIKQLTTTEIKISSDKKVYAQMDGELLCSDEFDIKVLPGKFFFKY